MEELEISKKHCNCWLAKTAISFLVKSAASKTVYIEVIIILRREVAGGVKCRPHKDKQVAWTPRRDDARSTLDHHG